MSKTKMKTRDDLIVIDGSEGEGGSEDDLAGGMVSGLPRFDREQLAAGLQVLLQALGQ